MAVRESLVAVAPPVDQPPRTEPGATREVSVDPDFIREKGEPLARQFSDLEIESIGREDLHR
jgi:hypothetical protein